LSSPIFHPVTRDGRLALVTLAPLVGLRLVLVPGVRPLLKKLGRYFGGIKKATKVEARRDGEKFLEQEITDFKPVEKVDPKTFPEPK
jgi:hypothetical protein